MKGMKTALCLSLGVFLGLSGCTMSPAYKRPAAPVAADWPTGAAYRETKSAASAPPAAELPWREFFTDERLQKIIATVTLFKVLGGGGGE